MRFFDVKNDSGISQMSDEQRKMSLFCTLPTGWHPISSPDAFCLFSHSASYALHAQKTQEFHSNIPINQNPMTKQMASPQTRRYVRDELYGAV